MANSIPPYMEKLMDIWDRRSTCGFYELSELFLSALAKQRESIVKKLERKKIKYTDYEKQLADATEWIELKTYNQALDQAIEEIRKI